MVATAMNVPTNRISATAEGDLDLAGTLGISKEAPVGFTNIRLVLDIEAPDETPEQIEALREKTEQYCVVMQNLEDPPPVTAEWRGA